MSRPQPRPEAVARPVSMPHALSRVARAAMLCATAALVFPLAAPLAHAQPAAQAVRAFAIPAGPLAQVVAQFANAAGVALSFDAAQMGPTRSDGLQGDYTVEAGFAKVLAGSGLREVRDANGTWALRSSAPPASASAAGAAGADALPTVTVSAEAGRPSPTTEQSGSFTTKSATLFKGVQSIREIPQPITVVTRQLMDERVLPDLHDVMQNTPGITVDYTDSERVNYYSRGYQIDALQVDGLTISQGGSGFVQPDTAVLDRIEVLRGASGMLRGSGNPSATVNLVRKRPTAEFQASAGLTLGSWNRRRIEADISGPLNEAGTLRARVVAVSDTKDFFQKAREEDRKVLYGVLEADLGPRTTLTASFQHTDLDATGAWGNLPGNLDGTPLNLPRDTYLGAAWNRWNRYNQQASAELEHRFDNDWNLKVSAAYTRLHLKDNGFKQSYFTRPAGATNPYLMNVTTSMYTGANSDQQALGVTANGPFTLFGRKHELVIGAESLRNKAVDSWGAGNLYPQNGVDIRTWNPYASYVERPVSISGSPNPTITRQQGAYATARLSITDPLTAIVGTRLSWWDYQVPSTPRSNYKVSREVTPYAGLVYDISNNFSAYASYTEIFTPQNAKDAGGAILDPVRGEDYEAGVKGEFLDGRLTGTLALFRINNVGKAVEDTSSANPCLPYNTSGYCSIAGGKTRSEGFELELAGEVAPGWQLMGGYTNTRTRYVRDSTKANVGTPLRSIDPRHQLRIFTSYRLGGALHGWTVGGGAQIQSKSYVTAGNVTSRQGGYAVYNAMLAYRVNKTYSVQLNVNNLFDKVYYKKYAPTGIGYYYGDPRNVMVSLRANF
jgi:outer membrane receptor for ferric coprogen and ferric-rhodotorulic acid